MMILVDDTSVHKLALFEQISDFQKSESSQVVLPFFSPSSARTMPCTCCVPCQKLLATPPSCCRPAAVPPYNSSAVAALCRWIAMTLVLLGVWAAAIQGSDVLVPTF
jgi:hypothetical protein